jgi:hypothetical protein
MLVIADSSALVALATCDALGVLVQIYEDVKVPTAVYDEVVVPEKPQGVALATFLAGRVVPVDMTRWIVAAGGLGRGELEAMALYKQLSADALLIDDRRARGDCRAKPDRVYRGAGILLLAKHKAVIHKIKPYVDKLRSSPLHYGEALLAKALSLADE